MDTAVIFGKRKGARRLVRALAGVCAVAGVTGSSRGATWTNGAGGIWSTSANWSGGVPNSGVDASFGLGSPGYGVTLGGASSAAVFHVANDAMTLDLGTYALNTSGGLIVGESSAARLTLAGSGALSVGSYEMVGGSTAGTVVHGSGTHSVTTELYLGYSVGSSGRYELSGTGVLNARNLYISYGGIGTFVQSGGTSNVSTTLSVGGRYELSGGALWTKNVTLSGGASVFAQSGGTHTISGSLTVSGSATYGMSGGKLDMQSSAVVDGSLALSGGTLVVQKGMNLGGTINAAGGSSSITMPKQGILEFGTGTLLNTGGLSITGAVNTLMIFPAGFHPATQLAAFSNPGVTAFGGSSVVIPVGKNIIGSATVREHLSVAGTLTPVTGVLLNAVGGMDVSGSGNAQLDSLTVEDSNSGSSGGILMAKGMIVGNSGIGSFTQTGGSASATVSLTLGSNVGSAGTYNLSAGTFNTTTESIGDFGDGTFIQSGGTHTVSSDLTFGYYGNGRGMYSLSGTGQLSVGRNETIGSKGAGTFVQTGGTHTVVGTLMVTAGVSPGSNYTLSAGTLTAGTLKVTGPGTFSQSGGTLAVNTLNVTSRGKMVVEARANQVVRVNSLSVDTASILDLNDNDLVVNAGIFSTLQSFVMAGYSAGPDNNKKGIISTTGQNSGGATILALFDNALAHMTEWPAGSGKTIAAGAVVGKYTYIGDTNMDGQVTPQDYTAVDSNLGTSGWNLGIAWFHGDTNFDGKVTAQDYAGIDSSLGMGMGNPLSASAMGAVDFDELSRVVPEPVGFGVVALGGVMLGRRRGSCPL
jgi:hypothetical protein